MTLQQGWSVVDAVEDEEEDEAELSSPVPAWTRSSPADLYFSRDRAVRLDFPDVTLFLEVDPTLFSTKKCLKSVHAMKACCRVQMVTIHQISLFGHANQNFIIRRVETCSRARECGS